MSSLDRSLLSRRVRSLVLVQCRAAPANETSSFFRRPTTLGRICNDVELLCFLGRVGEGSAEFCVVLAGTDDASIYALDYELALGEGGEHLEPETAR